MLKPGDECGLVPYLEEERARVIRLMHDKPLSSSILAELAAIQTCIQAVREDTERTQALGLQEAGAMGFMRRQAAKPPED